MIALAGMLGLMVIAIVIGKHTKKIYPSSYIVIAFLALIQVVFVLVKMYTMSEPTH